MKAYPSEDRKGLSVRPPKPVVVGMEKVSMKGPDASLRVGAKSSAPSESPSGMSSPSERCGPVRQIRQMLHGTPAGKAWRHARRTSRSIIGAIDQSVRRTPETVGGYAAERIRFLAARNPEQALWLARRSRRLAPRSRFFAEAEALLTARCRSWEAAAPNFERAADLSGLSASALLHPDRLSPPVLLAAPAPDRALRLGEAAARIVVYTTLVGKGQRLPQRLSNLEGVRFLCFTDQDVTAPGWEIVPLPAREGGPVEAAAFCKICPHEALGSVAPEAEASLFVAADMLMIGNLETLLTRWLLHEAFVVWRHARCIDWHDLAEQHLIKEPRNDGKVIAQAVAFERVGIPNGRGACDTRVLWRRHGQPEIVAAMDGWWRAFAEAPGADDLALYRLLNGPEAPVNAPPSILPAILGSSEDNLFFAAVPSPRDPAARRASRLPSQRRIPIAFLYEPSYAGFAATVLRGEQLSAMLGRRLSDIYDVIYTSDARDLRDHVVILNKWSLWVRKPAELAALRARNIAVIAGWDDGQPDAAKVAAVDGQMVLSIRQTVEMSHRFPKVPTFFVSIRPNDRIPAITPPMDRLRTGYFGELINTIRPESLACMVELNGINSTRATTSWIDALHHYNAHWIVRRRHAFDGYKPFLKGFVAARCGSVVIADRNDGDVAYYLGDDYPFYVRSLDPAQLELDMVEFTQAFGGPEWRKAQEIMAQVAERCADERICSEFRTMIDEIIG